MVDARGVRFWYTGSRPSSEKLLTLKFCRYLDKVLTKYRQHDIIEPVSQGFAPPYDEGAGQQRETGGKGTEEKEVTRVFVFRLKL